MNRTILEIAPDVSPKSSSKSIHLDSLFFPVEIYPLPNASLFPKLSFGQRFAQVVYLPFTDKVVNFTGTNYKLTTNEEFFAPIYQLLVNTFGYSSINVSTLNEDDSRFCVDFVITSKHLLVDHKDVINLMVRARNSYDSTLPASIEFLAYRQVCSNGLCAWQTFKAPGFQRGALKHFFDMSGLIDSLSSVLSSFDFKMDLFRPFTDRVVSAMERDLVIDFLKSYEGQFSFPKRILQEVPAKIDDEMKVLGSNQLSAWQLYNGFNYFLNHDTRINLRDNVKSQIDQHVKNTISDLLQIPSIN